MIQNFNSDLAASGVITAPSGLFSTLDVTESLTISGVPVGETETPEVLLITDYTQYFANNATTAGIDWNVEVYDRGGWHTNTSGPTVSGQRITIPAGVTRASFAFQVRVVSSGTPTLSTGRLFANLRHNGSQNISLGGGQTLVIAGTVPPVPQLGTSTTVNVSSPPIPVTPGDYFEVHVQLIDFGTNGGAVARHCFFYARKEH
jgi:hypothetical protein